MAGGNSEFGHGAVYCSSGFPQAQTGARRDSCGKCNDLPNLYQINSAEAGSSQGPGAGHIREIPKSNVDDAPQDPGSASPNEGRIPVCNPERIDSHVSGLLQPQVTEQPKREQPPDRPNKPQPSDSHRSHSGTECQRCRKLYQAKKRISRLRVEILAAREHVHNEREKLIQIRKENLDVNEELINLQKKVKSPEGTAADVERLDIIFEKAKQLFNEVITQGKLIRELDSRLGSLEYHLDRKETELYERAFTTEDEAAFDDDDISSGSSKALGHASDDEGEELPSLLAEYYDAAATVNEYLSRLQEWEDEHEEEVNARLDARDKEEPLDPPESVFERNYINYRTEMIQAYLQAKQDSQQLARLCHEAGYPIDFKDETPIAGLDHSWKHLPARNTEATDGERSRQGVSPVERMLLGSATPQERITSWLRDTLRSMSSRHVGFTPSPPPMSEGAPEPIEPPKVETPRAFNRSALNLNALASMRQETLDDTTAIGSKTVDGKTAIGSKMLDDTTDVGSKMIDGATAVSQQRSTVWSSEINMGKPHSEPAIDDAPGLHSP